MIEFEKRMIKPELHEDFYRHASEILERYVSRRLAEKAEAGSTRSERGYQLIAADISGRIARELGCSEYKAKMLCLSVGVCFPEYGHKGMKAIKQYIADHNIDLDLEHLDYTIAAYCLSLLWLGGLKPAIGDAYHDAAYDYFYGIDQNEESRIVRLVQETILEVKKAEPFYDGYPGDLLHDATRELVDLATSNKALTKGVWLEPYREKSMRINSRRLRRKNVRMCMRGWTSSLNTIRTNREVWQSITRVRKKRL